MGPQRDRGSRWALGDLLGLTTVGFVLVAIHLGLPPRLQAEFVFQQSVSRPETFLTGAYLHLDDQHLIGNVVGYAVVSLSAYLCCLSAGERRWFRATTAALLFVVPILVHASSMVLWATLTPVEVSASRGFSGVVAGFGGFLAVSLLVAFGRAYSRFTVRSVAFFLLFVVTGEIIWLSADSVSLLDGVVVAGGVSVLGLRFLFRNASRMRRGAGTDWARVSGSVVKLGLVVAVLSGLLFGLFPTNPFNGGPITNVFAHASGFGWGVVVSRWGYRYWGRPQD